MECVVQQKEKKNRFMFQQQRICLLAILFSRDGTEVFIACAKLEHIITRKGEQRC